MPCGQQGSWQYLCRRNCPPTSKGVPKRINFTPRREKGVNIWNGYPSSVTLLFGRHDRGKDLRLLLLLLFFPTGSHHPSISLSRVSNFFSSLLLRSQDSRYFESCSGKKFKTRLKRGNRGYVNLLQRENWLASVIDSYVLRLRSFEGTGICLTADLFSIHGQFDGAAAAAPAPALFAIRYNVACIWITFHDMSI